MPVKSRNPDYRCPPDHRHGEVSTCYSAHGCRCESCRGWRAQQWVTSSRAFYRRKRVLDGAETRVSAQPSQRRLRALATLGWSSLMIHHETGVEASVLRKIRSGTTERIFTRTDKKIAAAYRELYMVRRDTDRFGKAARSYALANGWHGPACWVNVRTDKKPDCRGACRR